MVFQPGQPKPPTSGRKPGTPNRRTTEIKNALQDFILRRIPELDTIFDNLHRSYNVESMRALTRLIALTLPRDQPIARSDMNSLITENQPDAIDETVIALEEIEPPTEPQTT